MKLGPWRWVLFGWCLLVALLAVVKPLTVLLQASFAKAWGRGFSLDNLTLRNYRFLLFEHDVAPQAVWNTVWFSGASATIAVVLALLVAYIVVRKLMRFADALGFLAMAPFVIPGIVMAIGFYAAYAGPPLSLYGIGAAHHPRLRGALPADRLCQFAGGDPRRASRDGGSRAHPRFRPACTPSAR